MTDATTVYPKRITDSGFTIYDAVDPSSDLYIPTSILQKILENGMIGESYKGMAIRTRSKVIKSRICELLGYPIPKSFTKEQPRFPGQGFDTYVQKANNLQIWNEPVDPVRRYVIVILNKEEVIIRISVMTGEEVAVYQRSETRTTKFQAKFSADKAAELASNDTPNIAKLTTSGVVIPSSAYPSDQPVPQYLLPIKDLYNKISGIVGNTFSDPGYDQERLRGEKLHRIVEDALGYTEHRDTGQFPDIRHQLLELKLQTSPTIDLGAVLPSSVAAAKDVDNIDKREIQHRDIRYLLVGASTNNGMVTIKNVILVAGKNFFERFPQMLGNEINEKIQIRLPITLWEETKSLFD
jgi:hypothetical protein